VESNVPAELFTEHGLPDVGVNALVVVGPWVRDFVCRERVILGIVLEGELSRTCKHRPLQLLEDFAIEGVYLGKGGRLRWLSLGIGRRLYVNRDQIEG